MAVALPIAGISIQAPLAGSDSGISRSRVQHTHFNPCSPCGERRKLILTPYIRYLFQSTLPLRGATALPSAIVLGRSDFNPRSPCGERLALVKTTIDWLGISIHAPLAGSDDVDKKIRDLSDISIHAPLAGSDMTESNPVIVFANFNPRSPCGERLTVQSAGRQQ